jgi:hypothetical protein
MKSLITINVHSFVDLITNSSSELFVCEGTKSVETVKEILLTLAKGHNLLVTKDYEKVPEDNRLFESVFSEPTLSQYTWDYWDVPEELRDEYEKYVNVHSRFEHSWYSHDKRNYENSPRYKKLQKKEREMQKNINPHEKGISEEEHDKRWKQVCDERDKIWNRWGLDEEKATYELFKFFLKTNGYTDDQISAIKYKFKGHGSWYNVGFEDELFYDLYNKFQSYLSYGIDVKKGNVVIESASDNTVPYSFMGSVCNYLNAKRWHLG